MAKTEQEERRGNSVLTILTVCYLVLSVIRLALTIAEIKKKTQDD